MKLAQQLAVLQTAAGKLLILGSEHNGLAVAGAPLHQHKQEGNTLSQLDLLSRASSSAALVLATVREVHPFFEAYPGPLPQNTHQKLHKKHEFLVFLALCCPNTSRREMHLLNWTCFFMLAALQLLFWLQCMRCTPF
jgi:hypothetical protein